MTARQIKDLINNQSKKNNIDAQILLRNYMMERLLERIAISKYKRNFVLKGGMLIAAMVGFDARSTVDMDATIKGYPLDEKNLRHAFDEILAAPVFDDVTITLLNISEIRQEAEYPCFRLSLSAQVEQTRIPLKVDITSGDVITPKEISYSFKLLLENRTIDIFAYNIETVLAEKIEAVISRGISNTRMRDFYDLYILKTLQSESIDFCLLIRAIKATASKRGTAPLFVNMHSELEKVLKDDEIIRLWGNYRKNFSYAADLEWEAIVSSLRDLFNKIEI